MFLYINDSKFEHIKRHQYFGYISIFLYDALKGFRNDHDWFFDGFRNDHDCIHNDRVFYFVFHEDVEKDGSCFPHCVLDDVVLLLS